MVGQAVHADVRLAILKQAVLIAHRHVLSHVRSELTLSSDPVRRMLSVLYQRLGSVWDVVLCTLVDAFREVQNGCEQHDRSCFAVGAGVV